MKRLFQLGVVAVLFVAWQASPAAESVTAGLSPAVLVVELGSVDGRAILRGSGMENLEEVRGLREGKTNNYVVGRPIALPDGSHELRVLVRPDAPLGSYSLVAITSEGSRPVPGRVEVVAVGDPRAQATAKGQDLNQAARKSKTNTLVADRDQVPQVTGTHPDPLMIPPDSQARTIRLAGRNLERVTDVRIRKDGDEARYRQNQSKLPFNRVEGFLDIRVVSDTKTPLGTKYWIDLMVENFRATSVMLEVGQPPPEPALPAVPAPGTGAAPTPDPAPTPGPRVIELPGPKPVPNRVP